MRWARAGVVLGLLLLALGFGVGIEPVSVSVAGQPYACRSPIPTAWFAAGPSTDATPRSGLVEARCEAAVGRPAWLTWRALGAGALVALVGWTALREATAVRAVGGLGRVRGDQDPAARAVHP